MADTVAGKQRDENVYFTMLPNIVLDMLADGRISRYDFTLYMVLLRTAGRSGHCRKSSRTLQQECDIGAGLLTQSKANLVEAGLINIEEVKRKNKRPFHRITIVDVWPENMRHFEGKYRNGGDSTPGPAPTDDDCSEPEQSCSESEQACSESESKKNTTNKNKDEEEVADATPSPKNHSDPTEHQEYFGAVAESCGMEPGLIDSKSAANVGRLASYLRGLDGIDPTYIRECGRLWYGQWPDRAMDDITPPRVAQFKTWIGKCRKGNYRRHPSDIVTQDGRMTFWSSNNRNAAPLVIKA